MAPSKQSLRSRLWVYWGLRVFLAITAVCSLCIYLFRSTLADRRQEAVAEEQLRMLTHFLGQAEIGTNGTYFFPLTLDENGMTDSRSGQWTKVRDLMLDPRTGTRFTYSPTNFLGERIQADLNGRSRFILWSEKFGTKRLIILNSLAVQNVEDSQLDLKLQTLRSNQDGHR
jgi:hypothetical protein